MTPAAPALAYDPQPNTRQEGGPQEPRPSPVTPAPMPPQGDIREGSESLMSPASSPAPAPEQRGIW